MHWGDNKGLENVAMAGHFWKKDEITWMQTGKLSAKTEQSKYLLGSWCFGLLYQ